MVIPPHGDTNAATTSLDVEAVVWRVTSLAKLSREVLER
jgi:hypothetical protein